MSGGWVEANVRADKGRDRGRFCCGREHRRAEGLESRMGFRNGGIEAAVWLAARFVAKEGGREVSLSYFL